MAEADKVEEPEFKWGKMRGRGGVKKDVQFYESFTYDGVEYTLHDSVYLYKEGEPEPYIGKLIKIWEKMKDKTKKVKVLWYFRPCEIMNFLEGTEVRENELFLACGEGLGLTNINPLEAIAGKCNVVCISKDIRNPQPLEEDLQSAEFVFHRFFDVGHRKILDKIDDSIAGVEVKNIFNNIDSQKHIGIVKLGLDKKDISGRVTKGSEVATSDQPMIATSDGKSFDILVREVDDSKPLLGEKQSIGVKEEIKSDDALPTVVSDKTMQQVEENGASTASLVKQKSSSKLLDDYGVGIIMGGVARVDDRQGDISIGKTISRSKDDLDLGENKVVKGLVGNMNKGLGEDIASQTKKRDVSGEVSKKKIRNDSPGQRLVGDDDDVKTATLSLPNERYKLQRANDHSEDGPSKKLKIDKNLPSKLPSGMFRKESLVVSPNVEKKLDCHATEVTRRPDVDRSKWFKGIPWEEKMKTAYERGTLVLLENLDPCLTSEQVQDIVWDGFKESCSAHVIQKTAFTCPHSGQAFVIFKRKETAEMVVRKLEEDCLLMSNGRPLVGRMGHPCFPQKKPIFYGHHFLDQLRIQREMKDAVSTSHCSQPNTIEYDMGMEWCLLQARADKSWRRLYQRQGEELRKLKAKLNTKI